MKKKVYIMLLLVLSFSSIIGFIAEGNGGRISESNLNEPLEGSVSREMTTMNNEKKGAYDELFFNKPDNYPGITYIKIYKKERVLELYGDDKLLGRFRIALGGSPEGHKSREGDSKTPEGLYYICTRNENSSFTLFLGLSYPNTEDAERGLQNNIISQEEFNSIKTAQELKQRPPWSTTLGGEVGIHGGGNTYDWTRGCIALADEDIRIVWDYAPYKTSVEIFE